MTTNGGPARLLRVYGLWILLITAVVMGAGYEVSTLAPTEYRSAAIVVVEARVRANTTPVPPEMGTEKELAHSGLVVEPAAKALGIPPGELGLGLTVSVAPDANVLTFAYDDPAPGEARRRAQALAEAYVDYRNSGDAGSSAPAAKTDVASGVNAHATLVTPAYLPSVPVARPIWIDLGIGLVLGLLLGVGTALVRDRLSDRVRGRDDFERISGAPVLATVPRTRVRGSKAIRPVLLRAPESPAAESYRYLRSRLQPLLPEGGATILVTSAHEGEGRSTTAANLALALALADRRVILVDADLRRPRLHTMFGRSDERGLTTVLAGQCGVAGALQDGPVSRLRLLAAGPGAGAAADLLEGPRLARLLRTLRQQCDVVVLDSAAVLSVSDAIALATVSDHVLLVGDYRRTTRGALARALAELREVVRGNVSGLLVNAPKSAGGLVPRPRDGAVPGAPAEAGESFALLDAEEDRPAGGRLASTLGSAVVHPLVGPPATAAGSTVYTSAAAPAMAPSAPVNAIRHAPAGPVKARMNGVDNRPENAANANVAPFQRGGSTEPGG